MIVHEVESRDIDDSTYPQVKVSSEPKRELIVDIVDPFMARGDELRKIDGLDAATKRRRARHLEKSYTGHGDAKSKRQDDDLETNAYNLFNVVMPRHNLDYFARVYELSSANYASIKTKVANIVALGYDFVETPATQRRLDKATSQQKKDNIRSKLQDMKQQLSDWLDDCNEEDTFTETMMKVWTDYEAMGNGYVEIGRSMDGTIGYIGHIPASTIRIRKLRDGFVQMVGSKARFFRNFGDLTTADQIGNDPNPNEIIHIKKYSPSSQFYGVPDIIAAQQAVVGNEFAARFNLDYFENKAVPRYVIVVKGGNLNQNSERNLLEFFETGLKGRNHRTLYVPMPPDRGDEKTSFTMTPVEAGEQDSSFSNYRRSNLADILMVHRVPLSKVTMDENTSLAASRDADKTFKEQVCRPEQDMLEKKLNKVFKQVSDGVFQIKLNELSLTDEDTVSQIDERYMRWGARTVNEVRRRQGVEAVPWGDQQPTMAGALTGEAAAKQQQKVATTSANAVQAQAAADQRAQAQQSRTRDANRSAAQSDNNGEARQTQGDGRAQA